MIAHFFLVLNTISLFGCITVYSYINYWRTSWLLLIFSNYEKSCCKYLHVGFVWTCIQLLWVGMHYARLYDESMFCKKLPNWPPKWLCLVVFVPEMYGKFLLLHILADIWFRLCSGFWSFNRCEKWKCSSLSRVWLFATPWTVGHQAPLSVGFSRQEYWSGGQVLLQRIFPTQGSNLGFPHCRQIVYCLNH